MKAEGNRRSGACDACDVENLAAARVMGKAGLELLPSASVEATMSSAASSVSAPATTSLFPPAAVASFTSVVPAVGSQFSKRRRRISVLTSWRQVWRER